MNLTIETEQETDGRWIAVVPQVPGALAYGETQHQAINAVKTVALTIISDQLDQAWPE